MTPVSGNNIKGRPLSVNARYVAAEKIILSLTAFFLVPYIIFHVGNEYYGYWVLLMSITAYFALMELGLPFAFDKYIAGFKAKNDFAGIKSVICTSFYALLCLGLFISLLVVTFHAEILGFFTQHEVAQRYPLLFPRLVLISLMAFLSHVFISVPRGFQRYDLVAKYSVSSRLVYTAIVIIGLRRGWGLNSLIIATFCYHFIIIAASVIITWRFLGCIPVRLRYFNRKILKELWQFGLIIQISSIAVWVAQNFDKLLISKYLGLSYVAYYDIGIKLVYALREIPLMSFGILIPRASELGARQEYHALRNLYTMGTQFITVFAAFCIAALFVNGQVVLRLWLGYEPHYLSIYVFKIMLVGTLFHITSGFASSILRGIGMLSYEAVANSIMIVCNIALSSFLMWRFGFHGVVAGTLVAYVTGASLIIGFANKVLSVSAGRFIRSAYIVPASLAGVCLMVNYLLYRYVVPAETLPGTIISLIASISIFAGYYLSVDRSFIRNVLIVLLRRD